VAIEFGDELGELQRRLERTGREYSTFDGSDMRIVFCADPAGNRWELRGSLA
jgi:hypothetical protein